MRVLPVIAVLCGSAHAEWKLVWADEFNGPNIDRTSWTYDIGAGGWGNGEEQYYTDRSENSRITGPNGAPGTGYLYIEARKENYGGSAYTSARMKTLGLKSWMYGRIEISALVPGGRGVWPALWALGTDLQTAGWPNCGEIDIMEHVENGKDMTPESVRGTIHGPGYSGEYSLGQEIRIPTLSTQFHSYIVEWDAAGITWKVEDQIYYRVTPSEIPGGPSMWRYDHPFFLLINLAIGGNWGGPPTTDTVFPVKYMIDYVRVYQNVATNFTHEDQNVTLLKQRYQSSDRNVIRLKNRYLTSPTIKV